MKQEHGQVDAILEEERSRHGRRASIRPKKDGSDILKTSVTAERQIRSSVATEPIRCPFAILVREDVRAMRMIECDHDGFPAFMLKLLRACYRTRDEALALVRAGDMVSIDFCLDFCETRESPDGSPGTSRAVPYRTDAVLTAAAGCGHIYAFDDETRLWHVWTSDGWRVDEDPTAPDLADMVEHLRARSEGLGDADVLPF